MQWQGQKEGRVEEERAERREKQTDTIGAKI